MNRKRKVHIVSWFNRILANCMGGKVGEHGEAGAEERAQPHREDSEHFSAIIASTTSTSNSPHHINRIRKVHIVSWFD